MAETQSMMLQRGEKRPSQQQATHEVCKRRAPYAPRACDACRRRKGRCDGRRPCEHCAGRSLECRYSSPGNGDDRRSNASASGPTLGSGSGNTGTVNQQQAQLQFLEQLRNQCLDTGPGPMSSADNNALTSLGSLVFSLQDQLATLTSYIKNQNPTSDVGSKQDTQATPPSHSQGSRTAFDALPAQSVEPPMCADAAGSVPTANSALKRSSCPFYGPTSPEYSFNAARITMSRDQHPSSTSRQRQPPSLSDELSDNDDDDDQCSTLVNDNDKLSPTDKMTGMSPFRLSPGLLLFSNVLSKKEAGRLLGVYQEIIGSLHPICDIQRMAKQLDRWYGWSLINDAGRTAGPLTRDELVREADELLVLGLALAIALSAESVSRSGLARELYDGFREAAMAKTFSPVPTERDVSITLMLGFYEYFNGRLQPAWRMCGLAGRMAMELGMHSREISQQMESEGRYSELATLTCSLLILDRQWSAAAGLPSNFQVTDFDSAQPGATQNPYLKAMMQFTLMSHKFNEPISRVAQGESCQDDDAFEITVCHIEQWRRKTLDNQDFSHALVWQKAPSTRPPSWTTMLYLRANAVRAIILRPFFLSSPASIACKKIKPALELITDSVTTLSILDSMTDTYRKQHPQFQHFLASSCSLLALVIAFEDQHHTELNSHADFPSDFATTVRQIYEKSLELSATYRELSCASRKLWKRLISMKSRVDNLSRSGNSQESGSTNGASNAETNPQAAYKNNTGGSIMGSGLGLGDNMLPITGNASRFVSNNDISTSQLMGMNGETLKEAGQSRPTSTQPNSGVALQTHFDDSRYMNWSAVSKTTAPARDIGLCMTDVVDITGDEFAASNQDLAEWFSFDWPICDGTTFFSEAGL